MERIQPDEFSSLVARYKNLIYTVCYSFCRNPFDAEDLAQETFYAVFRTWEHFDGKNERAWITKIAANKCRDYFRRSEKKHETLSPSELEILEDPVFNPEMAVLRQNENERMRSLIKKLKEPYQTVAVLYFLEDKKLSDVARQTGQKLKTLQTQLYRAKKALAILWEEEISHETLI